MNIARGTLAAALIVLAAAGCEDGVSPFECIDPGPVAVTVGAGDPPVFDWSPACGVLAVTVMEGAVPRWSVALDVATDQGDRDSNVIHPPVSYGVTRDGVSEYVAPAALEAGTTYTLHLVRASPPEGSRCIEQELVFCLVARHDFTR